MSPRGAAPLRFRYASDRSLYIDCGDAIGPDAHHRILRLLRWFERDPHPALLNLHPAYTSILVVFDPLRTTHEDLRQRTETACLDHVELPGPRTIDIPVHYNGPDLDDVAAFHNLTPQQVIDLHSSAHYTVFFLGFVPGFAYLGGLPDQLATPRLPSPRTSVPAGSVGIAGNQTGVYPFITPGGWRIIGHTGVKMFETSRPGMSLLLPGDHVRFRPE
jgi:inhibitor of KinA